MTKSEQIVKGLVFGALAAIIIILMISCGETETVKLKGANGINGLDGIGCSINGYILTCGSDTFDLARLLGQDGNDGLDGSNGEDGSSGNDGSPGQDGEDGQDGADGIDGTSCSVSLDESECAVIVCGQESVQLCGFGDDDDDDDKEKCNNGNGNGPEGCNSSENGNDDEA